MGLTIASQIIGYVATAVTLVALQQKKIKTILIFAIVSNALAGLSNFLIGGVAGGGICMIAVVQTLISLYCNIKRDGKVPVPVTLFFIACYVTITAVTYKTPFDLLPGAAAIIYALAVIQKKSSNFRILMILNSVAWIIYELTLDPQNFALAATFLLQLISTLIGIVRLDIMKKKSE